MQPFMLQTACKGRVLKAIRSLLLTSTIFLLIVLVIGTIIFFEDSMYQPIKWKPSNIKMLNESSIKCYTITDGTTTATHRFFDSSPFSPNNSFIAFTNLPIEAEYFCSTDSSIKYPANIVLVDLSLTQPNFIVDKTFAWGRYNDIHKFKINIRLIVYDILKSSWSSCTMEKQF